MKNEEKLLYTIGEVDPKYVPSEKKRKHLLLKCTAIGIAAAAAVMGFAMIRGGLFSPMESTLLLSGGSEPGIDIVETAASAAESDSSAETEAPIPEVNGLPQIPYKSFCWNSDYEESSLGGGIGYNIGGYGYRLIDGNPWKEEQGITSLPVYKNLSYYGDYEYPDFYLGEETMKKMAEKAAEALGVTIRSSDMFNSEAKFYKNLYNEADAAIEGDMPFEYRQDDWFYNVYCDGGDYGVESVDITVCSRGDMLVLFNNNEPSSLDPDFLKLPEEYLNDEKALSDYLKGRFKALLDFDSPSDSITFETYNVTDDPVQNILNYSLENVKFIVRGDNLVSISIRKMLSVAELAGEYEIITPEEAKEKLLSLSENFKVREGLEHDEPRIMPNAENIAGINIVYPDRTKGLEDLEYFKPYYVIYVNSGNYADDTYSLYYIPALKDEYILN